jgi:bacterioferritin (cytochrome b1)
VAEEKDPMEVEEALEALNTALALQARSALAFTHVAGGVRGLAYQAVGSDLWRFATEELDDLRRLVEKVVALGGEPSTEVAEVRAHESLEDAVSWLVDIESETVAALAEVIPYTGNEGPGEALEHLLEHIIMRKQEQVDYLVRALGDTGANRA